jgi:TRAP-type mannitol/chloroaromatic compound transport system permease small subunit
VSLGAKVMSNLNEGTRKEPMDDQKKTDFPFLPRIKGWRSVHWIIVMLGRVSALLILFIMMITVVDVVLRYIFKAPLKGAYEFSEIFFLSSVFLGTAYTQLFRGHVNVDILITRLSSKTNLILEICMLLIALPILGLLTWQGAEAFLKSFSTGEYKWGLIKMPLWPARLMIPVGVCVLCLTLIGELSVNLTKLFDQKKRRR